MAVHRSGLARVLEPEMLDHLAPNDPAAQRARRDLRRVNAFMRARAILGRALAKALPGERRAPVRLLEIGCGDGLLMLDVARREGSAWPPTELTLLDRLPIVAPETLAAYAACRWRVETRVVDVVDWAAQARDASERWDAVIANLFLHHFEGVALAHVLAGCAARSDALVACEPRRSPFALAASHLVFFLGANAVTRRDAVLSVRAGFRDRELRAAWPGVAGEWHLDEYDDGFFTHCFVARRRPIGK